MRGRPSGAGEADGRAALWRMIVLLRGCGAALRAGKTTLLQILAGQYMVDRDAVRVLGRPAFHDIALTSSGELSYLGQQWRRDIAFAGYNVPIQVPTPLPPSHCEYHSCHAQFACSAGMLLLRDLICIPPAVWGIVPPSSHINVKAVALLPPAMGGASTLQCRCRRAEPTFMPRGTSRRAR